MQEKLQELLDTLECENQANISTDTDLSDIEEWDSMGKISLITLLATKYNYTLSFDELKVLSKVSDILKFMK
ncbi:hypothetical protein YZ82_07645 [Campylobacter hyointestinalis]|uniref:Acyl carrier protein n=2 Tax=Campylobacter TaxID=194 RepID=A0A562XBB3_CAMHY|nr:MULTISPECIES: hypothetical protein [Campylobacter]ANE34752.1 hypothetical protein CHL_1439 [Campylobacter hyointestinalis subsp. lawsonii CCUG 27631]MDO2409223.1 hypothetical protein [Campylobacter magnus]TWO18976.1 hypothetical protein YZ82_07645 [Campylobacter hyointestinalis]